MTDGQDSAPHGPAPQKRLVELISWWFAPGEAQAVEALIAAHKLTHPGARIFNSALASGTIARELLDQRLAHGNPPDLFLEYVHAWSVDGAGKANRRNLDDLFEKLHLRDVLLPEVLGDVTRDGHVFVMPVNIHRENALFYNRKIFAAYHLDPPKTFDAFLQICDTLKEAGVTPIATANQGWILRIMFNTLAMGRMGAVRYHDTFTGKSAPDIPLLTEIVRLFAYVLDNYTNVDAGDEGFNWTNAAQAVYNGDAAMLLHGDWAKGYFVQLGWNPDVDFGVVGAPGASDLFLYGIDAFALPLGAKNEPGALDFLTTVASVPGQVAFNRFKGSTPIRRDVPRDQLDALGRATLEDLENAKIRMLVRGHPLWEDALTRFGDDHDQAALLKALLQDLRINR
jgi:glucose/mannose transport system substrate-binding protein